jgi:hypothetical protein
MAMLSFSGGLKVLVAVERCDLRLSLNTPSRAGRIQWVKFPAGQGRRALPPGIESWTHQGNEMSQV